MYMVMHGYRRTRGSGRRIVEPFCSRVFITVESLSCFIVRVLERERAEESNANLVYQSAQKQQK